jgi:hypothetical protein
MQDDATDANQRVDTTEKLFRGKRRSDPVDQTLLDLRIASFIAVSMHEEDRRSKSSSPAHRHGQNGVRRRDSGHHDLGSDRSLVLTPAGDVSDERDLMPVRRQEALDLGYPFFLVPDQE